MPKKQSRLKSLLKLKLRVIKRAAKVIVYTAAVVLTVLSIPRLHTHYIRGYVGGKVVMLTNADPGVSPRYGGGTGFHVTAPSGKTVVVSNRHVCVGGEKQGFMYGAVRGETKYVKLKILEMYTGADLCVLEPIEGIGGLSVGEKPIDGQSVWAVGHPNLQPKTVTRGEVQGFEWMEFPSGIVGQGGYAAEDCKYENERMIQVPDYGAAFMKVVEHLQGQPNRVKLTPKLIEKLIDPRRLPRLSVCLAKNLSLVTTINAYKGNSGSPVTDDLGNVVAVIFAMNSDGMWGRAITLADLNKLLSKY